MCCLLKYSDPWILREPETNNSWIEKPLRKKGFNFNRDKIERPVVSAWP